MLAFQERDCVLFITIYKYHVFQTKNQDTYSTKYVVLKYSSANDLKSGPSWKMEVILAMHLTLF